MITRDETRWPTWSFEESMNLFSIITTNIYRSMSVTLIRRQTQLRNRIAGTKCHIPYSPSRKEMMGHSSIFHILARTEYIHSSGQSLTSRCFSATYSTKFVSTSLSQTDIEQFERFHNTWGPWKLQSDAERSLALAYEPICRSRTPSCSASLHRLHYLLTLHIALVTLVKLQNSIPVSPLGISIDIHLNHTTDGAFVNIRLLASAFPS